MFSAIPPEHLGALFSEIQLLYDLEMEYGTHVKCNWEISNQICTIDATKQQKELQSLPCLKKCFTMWWASPWPVISAGEIIQGFNALPLWVRYPVSWKAKPLCLHPYLPKLGLFNLNLYSQEIEKLHTILRSKGHYKLQAQTYKHRGCL